MNRVLTIALSFVAFCGSLATADEPAKVFRAGAFAQNINPEKYPISVNGGMADRLAKSAADPLHARCLVLDDGENKLAIVVCDSCMIPREITDEAKRLAHQATGIAPQRIVISATHTHSAPTLGHVFQSAPDPDYAQLVPKLIAKGIEKAHANLQPAKIGWGVGTNQDQVYNRRWKRELALIPPDPFGKTTDKVQMNPGYQAKGLIESAGPIDPDVSFISVQTAEGRPLAFFANYSLHYVGGVPELSADYFAIFADKMGELLGAKKEDGFVGAMSNGTSGDCNNINFASKGPGGKQGPYEQARLVADSVARSALAAHKKINHFAWVPLASAQTEIELGVRRPSPEEVTRAKDILAKAKTPVLQGLSEIYAGETVALAQYPAKVKVILQAHKIGNLGIVANPCETFAEIGLAIKKASPLKHTFTIELANGYNGYLPTPAQHALGGYETWRARSSYLEVNASDRIMETWRELLKEIAK